MPDTAGRGDLWMRASRLRGCCEIVIDAMATPPRWRVVVRPHDLKMPSVDGVGEHLVDAMGEAVNRAEAQGLGPKQF